MTIGIKVSLPGKDISSTNPQDFILHSQYGSAVIYKEAEVSVTIAAGGTTKSTVYYYDYEGVNQVTFPYIPIVYIMAELNAGSGKWYSSPFTFTQFLDIDALEETGILSAYAADTAIENNRFYITFYNRTGVSKTIKYHYYIFANLAVV
jgi:hypothetical protein